MQVAVVDIGTNSTRLLLAQMQNGQVVEEVVRRTEITRLGRGVDQDGSLSAEGMDRVFTTLGSYRELVDDHGGAEVAVAVLTSAVRDASNGETFAAEVGARYGFEPHVLSGDDEARTTFLGATSERDPGDETLTLVIDIGGGSTETVIGRPGLEPDFHVSNQVGVVRQTERHLHHDPPQPEELDALAADARAIIAAGVPEDRRRSVGAAIAVAGTPTQLAAIAQSLEPYDSARVHGFRLAREDCERMLAQLAAVPLEERRKITGLHPDRAPTIVAGAVILLVVLDLFGLDNVEVSEHDILRGAALAFTRK